MPPFRFSHGASQAISVSLSALSVSASAFRRRAFSFVLTATTRDCLLPRYNRIVCGTDDVLRGEPPFKVELHCVGARARRFRFWGSYFLGEFTEGSWFTTTVVLLQGKALSTGGVRAVGDLCLANVRGDGSSL